ncbi:MAG: hypothetical protein ACTSQF_14545 [Candidatus Heimdallarchaeaceae archaeon]
MIEEMFFLDIIEFYLKFWLISLALRWLISFLPWKVFDIFRFIGNLIRFPIKRFFYWIYGVKIEETDLEKSTFITEEVTDFDCRITSNIIGPLLIQTYIGSFILYWANELYPTSYTWLSIVLYIIGFCIILMSAPDFKETEELLRVSVKSIFKWFGKLVLLSIPAYLLIYFLVGIETLAQGIFILTLLIPVFYNRKKESGERWVKSKKAKIVEADPFGE